MVIVIDASVAVKWFVLEEESEAALAFLHAIESSPRSFAVPELIYFEIASALFRTTPILTPERWQFFDHLLKLGWQRFSLSLDWAQDVLELVLMGLSAYDAAYAALARRIGGIWLTADERAHKKIEKLGISKLLS